MKLEIDLSEIFEDEDGNTISSSLTERIEHEIVKHASDVVTKLVKEKFEREISTQLSNVVKSVLTDLVNNLIDKPYKPTTHWGEEEEITTIRNQICKDVEKVMKTKESSYDRDNIYTTVIKDTVNVKLKEFSKEFTKEVDAKLVAECMQLAVEKLKSMSNAKNDR